MTASSTTLTAQEWDSIRKRFRDSMMVDTEIIKLAQNLDLSWPLKGSDETPLKYIGLTRDELEMMPGLGSNPERMRLLHDILAETMAFDDPFGEMAEQVDSSSKHDDGARRTLEKLGVPLHYPIQLCAVSADTKSFCDDEGVLTLDQFIELSQRLAQSVVVGGDFRSFLNTLAHPDPKSISKFLPMRIGHTGLHLPEAIAQTLSIFNCSEKAHLYRQFGVRMPVEELGPITLLDRHSAGKVMQKIDAHLRQVFAFFDEDYQKLQNALAEGPEAVVRFFAPLGHADREKMAIALTKYVLGEKEEEEEDKPKKGFFARLFGRR